MSKNQYKKQVWVLPEDDANRQIARGFELVVPEIHLRDINIEPVAGGWSALRDSFEGRYNKVLLTYPLCLMVMLVDFDDRGERRLEDVLSRVDATLKDRVFVLGAHGEPEELRKALGMGYEQIGKTLARECSDGRRVIWEHPLLVHNRVELERMVDQARPILFG